MDKKYKKILFALYIVLILIGFISIKTNNSWFMPYLFLGTSILMTINYMMETKRNWFIISLGILFSVLLLGIIILK